MGQDIGHAIIAPDHNTGENWQAIRRSHGLDWCRMLRWCLICLIGFWPLSAGAQAGANPKIGRASCRERV